VVDGDLLRLRHLALDPLHRARRHFPQARCLRLGEVAWIVFVIVLPYVGVFVYLIAEHQGMTERAVRKQQESQAEADHYVRSVAVQTNPADQVAHAKDLLDSGAITETEFVQMKQQALAT
jgi:ABC-type Fe3+ transport system permease subunit